MNNDTFDSVTTGVGTVQPPINKVSRVRLKNTEDTEDSKIDISQVEIMNKGSEGKLIYVPSVLRTHIYTYLDVNDLFDMRGVGVQDETLDDISRRRVKESFSIPLYQIITRVDEIKESLDDYGPGKLDESDIEKLFSLIAILEGEKKLLEETFGKEGIPDEVLAEELTMFLNVKGSLFSYRQGDVTFGFITESCVIKSSFTGTYINILAKIHANFGEGTIPVLHGFQIPYFRGHRSLKDLGIARVKPDSELFESLEARGKKYVSLVENPSYCYHKGAVVRRSWWTDRKFKADGRIMIDNAAMRNIDPDYDKYLGYDRHSGRGRDELKLTTFTPEQYVSMSPYIYGFSFSAKVWGETQVENISEIKFRDNAYDMLVMEPETKDMIFALVDNSVAGSKDFIDGKGGGCIFLLAGPPGGGKTLTAEAIAERLGRPLYMVGVGELGTDVEMLEESLRKILDVATTWNAVLLIDECDIFMEKRSDMDVHRNAMVGVFLRLLEYYEGVLFLTTNRAQNIDEAFYSRISMALHYDPLNMEARKTVWKNLLEVYDIKEIEALDSTYEDIIDHLSNYELNGRKIKGVIRIAKALAAADKRKVNVDDFLRVINKEREFKEATERHKVAVQSKL